MQQIAKNFPENLVNLRIYVYWPHDEVWYRGKVIKNLPTSRKFKVVYDDKREEKLDLTKELFLVDEEDHPKEDHSLTTKTKSNRGGYRGHKKPNATK